MKKIISLFFFFALPLTSLLNAGEPSQEFSLTPSQQELIRQVRLHHKNLVKEAPQSARKELQKDLAEERKNSTHAEFFGAEPGNDDVFFEEHETPSTLFRSISSSIPFSVRRAFNHLKRDMLYSSMRR